MLKVRCQEHCKNQMLASTIQFSNTNPTTPEPGHQPNQRWRYETLGNPGPENTHPTGVVSGPNSAPTHQPPAAHPDPFHAPSHREAVLAPASTTDGDSASSSTNSLSSCPTPHSGVTGNPPPTPRKRVGCELLLRKEVIQPHLPVRLPCYDFVPIASPTFDHSLPHGLGHGLRVLPTFVT
jgi:hypothetical protein